MIHNPYSLLFRDPVGAVTIGQTLTLRARLTDLERVFLILIFPDGHSEQKPMEKDADGVSASVCLEETGLYHYAFCVESGRCIGLEGENTGLVPGSTWPLTVYDPAFNTPEWFRDSICYQIFPDRFHKSGSSDPEERALIHRQKGRRVCLHADWTEEPRSEAGPGEKEYVPDDYFGGDLKGIEEKLPYLKELGVGCLYLNPIFEADSNHRYNTADYRRIDPMLGTSEDFLSLTKKAKTYGIRVILDGVFSHTGADSRYFDINGTYGGGAYHDPSSLYRSWYRFEQWPDTYECWWGFRTLPNVEETDPSYGAFIHGADGVLAAWQKAGAKGWRLDVADELPEAFIRDVRKRIKTEDPEAVLLGEVWEDASDKQGPEGRRTYVDGQELDGCMNYPLRKAILRFLNGESDAYACEEELLRLYTHYPRPFYEACLNLISSHDEVRALSYLSGAPDRYKASRKEQGAFVPSEAALARGKRLFLIAAAMQMTLPGVPCIYYGDEAGLSGMGDPFNRRTFPWGREDKQILSAVKQLCALRNGSEALHKEAAFRAGALSSDVFCILRHTQRETALLFINRSEASHTVSFYPSLLNKGQDGFSKVSFGGTYADTFTGEQLQAGGALRIPLGPVSFRLLLKKA